MKLPDLEIEIRGRLERALRLNEAGLLGSLGGLLDEIAMKSGEWESRYRNLVGGPQSTDTSVAVNASHPGRWIGAGNPGDLKYTKPVCAELFGDQFGVRNWKQVWLGVIERVRARHRDDFETRALLLTGDTREYLSRDRTRMHSPFDIGGGIYVETNFSSDYLVGLCAKLLHALGHHPDELRVALDDRPNISQISINQNTRRKRRRRDISI